MRTYIIILLSALSIASNGFAQFRSTSAMRRNSTEQRQQYAAPQPTENNATNHNSYGYDVIGAYTSSQRLNSYGSQQSAEYSSIGSGTPNLVVRGGSQLSNIGAEIPTGNLSSVSSTTDNVYKRQAPPHNEWFLDPVGGLEWWAIITFICTAIAIRYKRSRNEQNEKAEILP